MFDKLVVSAKEKSKGRTKKFFLMTTFIYSFVLASALAVSVYAANTSLFERSEITHLVPILPPPLLPLKGTPRVQQGPPSQVAQPNPYKVATLEQITHPESNNLVRAGIKIPTVGTIGDNGPGVIGDPNGVANGDPASKGIGVPTGLPHGEEMAPPPPLIKKPEPPSQKEPENKVVRLASNILTGKAIARKTPDYPALAKQVHVEGSIVVEIVISPEGRVESARALNGHPLLTKPAIDAAYAWRFEPTILNGLPVRVTGVITFNFKLN